MAENAHPFDALSSFGAGLIAPTKSGGEDSNNGTDDLGDLDDKLGIIQKEVVLPPKGEETDDKEDDNKDKNKEVDIPPKEDKSTKEPKTTKQQTVYKSLFEALEEEEVFTVKSDDPVEYSPEGLKTRFLAEKEAVKKAAVEEYLSGFKDTKVVEFLKNGGDIKDYYEKVSSRAIDWSLYTAQGINTSVEARKVTIAEYMKAQGETDDAKIAKRINALEGAKLAEDEVEMAHKFLLARQAKAEDDLMAETTAKAEKLKADDKLVQDKLDEIINKKPIGGFDPTPKVRKALHDFMIKVDANGLTERDKKEKSLTNEKALERRVLMNFLEMVDFDLDKLSKMTKSKAINKLADDLEALGEDSATLRSTKVRKTESNDEADTKIDFSVISGGLGI